MRLHWSRLANRPRSHLAVFTMTHDRMNERAALPGQAFLDVWSIVHVLSGMGLRLAGFGLASSFAVLIGYEIIEAGLRRIKVKNGGIFEYESWPNILADIVCGMGGYSIVWLALPPWTLLALP